MAGEPIGFAKRWKGRGKGRRRRLIRSSDSSSVAVGERSARFGLKFCRYEAAMGCAASGGKLGARLWVEVWPTA